MLAHCNKQMPSNLSLIWQACSAPAGHKCSDILAPSCGQTFNSLNESNNLIRQHPRHNSEQPAAQQTNKHEKTEYNSARGALYS